MKASSKNNTILFDQCLVVQLEVSDTGEQKPKVVFTFDKSSTLSSHIAPFCFPDLPLQKDRIRIDTFTFVRTDNERYWQYGFCKYVPAPIDFGSPFPLCICIQTYHPWFHFFEELLSTMADLVISTFDESIIQQFLDGLIRRPFPDVDKRFDMGLAIPDHQLKRPIETDGPLVTDRAYSKLFDAIGESVVNIIVLFTSLLCERRIIMTSSDLSVLSDSVHAAAALLYPFQWQHMFVPIVPPNLLAYCEATIPFIVGVPASQMAKVKRMRLEQVTFVNLDDGSMMSTEDTSILPREHVDILRYSIYEVLNNPAKSRTIRNRTITNAFREFFLAVFGRYGEYMIPKGRGTYRFDKEAFIRDRPRSARKFIEAFSQSQMFDAFAQTREQMWNDLGPTHLNELFEREAALFVAAAHHSHLFSSNASRSDKLKDSFTKVMGQFNKAKDELSLTAAEALGKWSNPASTSSSNTSSPSLYTSSSTSSSRHHVSSDRDFGRRDYQPHHQHSSSDGHRLEMLDLHQTFGELPRGTSRRNSMLVSKSSTSSSSQYQSPLSIAATSSNSANEIDSLMTRPSRPAAMDIVSLATQQARHLKHSDGDLFSPPSTSSPSTSSSSAYASSNKSKRESVYYRNDNSDANLPTTSHVGRNASPSLITVNKIPPLSKLVKYEYPEYHHNVPFIELHQGFAPGRSRSLMDIIAPYQPAPTVSSTTSTSSSSSTGKHATEEINHSDMQSPSRLAYPSPTCSPFGSPFVLVQNPNSKSSSTSNTATFSASSTSTSPIPNSKTTHTVIPSSTSGNSHHHDHHNAKKRNSSSFTPITSATSGNGMNTAGLPQKSATTEPTIIPVIPPSTPFPAHYENTSNLLDTQAPLSFPPPLIPASTIISSSIPHYKPQPSIPVTYQNISSTAILPSSTGPKPLPVITHPTFISPNSGSPLLYPSAPGSGPALAPGPPFQPGVPIYILQPSLEDGPPTYVPVLNPPGPIMYPMGMMVSTPPPGATVLPFMPTRPSTTTPITDTNSPFYIPPSSNVVMK